MVIFVPVINDYLQGYKVIWANAIQDFHKYENQREEEEEGAESKVGEGGGKFPLKLKYAALPYHKNSPV